MGKTDSLFVELLEPLKDVKFFKISFEALVLLFPDILCCVERLFCVINIDIDSNPCNLRNLWIKKTIKRYTVD